MIALVAVSIFVIAMTACPAPPANPTPTPTPTPHETPAPPPTPPTPTETPAQPERAQVTTTEGMPDGWPESIPVMEGLTVVSGAIGAEGAPFSLGLYLSGNLPKADVFDFYTTLPGWTLNEEESPQGSAMFTNEAGEKFQAIPKEMEDGTVQVGLIYFAAPVAEETTETAPADEAPPRPK